MTDINWENLRKELEYETEKEMMVDLYETYHSLGKLAGILSTSVWTVRRKLESHGIEIKKRGGANNTKLEVFDEALHEKIQQQGLINVAKEMGLTPFTLIRRRKLYLASKGLSEGSSPQPTEPQDTSAPQEESLEEES